MGNNECKNWKKMNKIILLMTWKRNVVEQKVGHKPYPTLRVKFSYQEKGRFIAKETGIIMERAKSKAPTIPKTEL